MFNIKKSFLFLVLALMCLIIMPSFASATTGMSWIKSLPGATGDTPNGSLTPYGNKLYGTMSDDGSGGSGVIFSINPDGSGYTVVYAFNGTSDYGNPYGSLLVFESKFYGTTRWGGTNGLGAVFSINPDGSDYTILHSFDDSIYEGQQPEGSLIISGTTLYGMTVSGGANNWGVIFSLGTNGSNFYVMHSFAGDSTDGGYGYGDLYLIGIKLYGMTNSRGSGLGGTIFSINTDGSGYTTIHSFAGGATDGSILFGTLSYDGTKFYGVTSNGGVNGQGTIFFINPDGSGMTVMHSFVRDATDGGNPLNSLTLYGNTLYGMAYRGGLYSSGTIFSINTDGSGYTTIYNFTSNENPQQNNLIYSGGTLYGMSSYGGAPDYNGTIFAYKVIDTTYVSSITVTAAGSATTVVDGNNLQMSVVVLPADATDASVTWSVTNGSGSATIDSSTGLLSAVSPGAVTVTATANDGSAVTGIYEIAVTSNDATLSNLVISVGTLTPAFASGTISYTNSAANDITSVTVTPTANQANATIKVNSVTVASGSSSGSINLSVGSNTITTLVTAQDGVTTDTYTITVMRADAGGGGGSYYYTISVNSGMNGFVSPPDSSSFISGSSQTFTITPYTGYQIADVLVDGSSVGSVNTYTFNNITTNHIISATFLIIPITPSAPVITPIPAQPLQNTMTTQQKVALIAQIKQQLIVLINQLIQLLMQQVGLMK